jgi:hypothetical protein
MGVMALRLSVSGAKEGGKRESSQSERERMNGGMVKWWEDGDWGYGKDPPLVSYGEGR